MRPDVHGNGPVRLRSVPAAIATLVAAGLAASMAPGVAAQSVTLDTMVTLRRGDPPQLAPLSGKTLDVDVDDLIHVEWDEAALIQALGRSLGIVAQGDSLDQRIAFLRDLTERFTQSQAALMELREAAAALAAARLAGPEADVASRVAARDAVSNRFSAVAGAGIDRLLQVEASGFEPAEARDLLTAADAAVLEDSYEPLVRTMGEFLEPRLTALARELDARVGDGAEIRVYMSAWMSGSGISRRVHLDRYDNLPVGDPTPFPRVQLALGERTRQELESARRFQEIVEDPGVLRREVEAALRAVTEELTALREVLGSDVLLGQVRRLEQDLRAASVDALAAQVRQARDLLETLSTVPDFETADDVQVLLVIADRLDGQLQGFLAAFSALGSVLPNLATTLGDRAAEFPDAIRTETIDALDAAGRALRERPEVQAVATRVSEIAVGLGLTRRVHESGRGVVETARRVDPNRPLDTFLDLMTVGERHPGDRIDIRARVVIESPGGAETIALARQTLRLRVEGVYLEPRGALIFADPRTGDFTDISYQPTVAVSYVAHWGRMGHGFWNDVFNPGLGATLSLHQFDPERDFELGIAGTVTLFRDLFLVGYGRNLQARADYVFVGVNPLAVGSLWQPGGSGPPAGEP